MSESRHTEAQMIGALKQLQAGRKAEDVAREAGVSKHTISVMGEHPRPSGAWTDDRTIARLRSFTHNHFLHDCTYTVVP